MRKRKTGRYTKKMRKRKTGRDFNKRERERHKDTLRK